MLDIYSLYFAKVCAYACNLVFDIHEESWLFSEIHLRCIEHALEQDTVALLITGLRGEAKIGVWVCATVRSRWIRSTRQHRVLVTAQLLHECGAVRRRVNVGVRGVLT